MTRRVSWKPTYHFRPTPPNLGVSPNPAESANLPRSEKFQNVIATPPDADMANLRPTGLVSVQSDCVGKIFREDGHSLSCEERCDAKRRGGAEPLQRWKFCVVTSTMSRNFSLRFLTMSSHTVGMVEDGENASGGDSLSHGARGAVLQRECPRRRTSRKVQLNRERVRDW